MSSIVPVRQLVSWCVLKPKTSSTSAHLPIATIWYATGSAQPQSTGPTKAHLLALLGELSEARHDWRLQILRSSPARRPTGSNRFRSESGIAPRQLRLCLPRSTYKPTTVMSAATAAAPIKVLILGATGETGQSPVQVPLSTRPRPTASS